MNYILIYNFNDANKIFKNLSSKIEDQAFIAIVPKNFDSLLLDILCTSNLVEHEFIKCSDYDVYIFSRI